MLTPPGAPEFPYLLDAIRTRSAEKVEGAPPRPNIDALTPDELACSAILLNYSNKTIQELAVWWQFETPGARPRVHCRTGLLGQADILPLQPRHPLLAYWNTIMPGSVRLLTREHLFGDNRDIRPPLPEELHHGGWMQMFGGQPEPLTAESVRLELDSVLFAGGEFTGEDKCGMWVQFSAEVGVKNEAAAIARNASAEGLSSEDVLSQLLAYTNEDLSGPSADQRHKLREFLVRSRDDGCANEAIQSLLRIAESSHAAIRRI